MRSESADSLSDHLGPATLLLVGILYICHRFGLPTWALPLVGILLALPLTMVRDRRFGLPRTTHFPVALLAKVALVSVVIVGLFGCLAFIGKWLLGLGAPTSREIVVLFATILMLVGSSLLEIKGNGEVD